MKYVGKSDAAYGYYIQKIEFYGTILFGLYTCSEINSVNIKRLFNVITLLLAINITHNIYLYQLYDFIPNPGSSTLTHDTNIMGTSYAGMLIFAVGISMYVISQSSFGFCRKILIAYIILTGSYLLVFGLSRFTAVAMVIILIVLMIMKYYDNMKGMNILMTIVAAISAFIICSQPVLNWLSQIGLDRITRRFSDMMLYLQNNQSDSGSVSGRMEVYRASIRTFLSNPLLEGV